MHEVIKNNNATTQIKKTIKNSKYQIKQITILCKLVGEPKRVKSKKIFIPNLVKEWRGEEEE